MKLKNYIYLGISMLSRASSYQAELLIFTASLFLFNILIRKLYVII